MKFSARWIVAFAALALLAPPSFASAQSCPNGRCPAPPRVTAAVPMYRAPAPASIPAYAQTGYAARQSVRATPRRFLFKTRVRATYAPPTAFRSVPASAPAAPVAVAPAAPAAGDPYGFMAILNDYRRRSGLNPLAHDPGLAAWAASNNSAQVARGLGHHVNPGARQNSGWNYRSAQEVAVGWINSSGHRANLLARGVTVAGIAYGPGPYWTLNLK